MSPRPAKELTIADLREHLEAVLEPEALRVQRGADGLLIIRALSSLLEDVDDPLEWLEKRLEKRRVRLPERALLILKAPGDVDEEERAALFAEPTSAFAGIPNWADALALEPLSTPIPDDRGFARESHRIPIVSFWGVKGGVGRTTALAHTATLLGRRGKRVLVLDLDLDSPGLRATLADGSAAHQGRFEDLMRDAANAALGDDELRRRIQRALVPATGSRQVDVLGPAHADTPFVQALLGPLAPPALYRGRHSALRRLIRQAIVAASADIVLVDARSGFCDESAIAVLDLSDQIVLFASPAPSTYDSLQPAIEGIERHRSATGRPAQLHVVAGMLPASEPVRQVILEELRAKSENARELVRQALATPPDKLPPDIEVIELDYSARIVENQGAVGMDFRFAGYVELAERIWPPPLPDSVAKVESGWVAKVYREIKIPVAQAESEEDIDTLAQLFTSTAELQYFARPDVCLVLGAKGTGKSYLHRMCLLKPELVASRSGVRSLDETLFVDGLSDPRARTAGAPLLTTDVLRELHAIHGKRWSELWSALALARAFARLASGSPINVTGLKKTGFAKLIHALSEAATPKTVLQRAGKVMAAKGAGLELDDLWHQLDELCERRSMRLCLLFDWLDMALGDEPGWTEPRDQLIRGLVVRSDASWLSRRNLTVKLFLREDIFRRLELEEAAKYENRKVELKWREEDIWRLVIRAVAVGSASFAELMNARGVLQDMLESVAESDWRAILELIWGERLGNSEGDTRSTVWARRRLSDGRGYLFPRAALWLLQAAFEERKRKGIDDNWQPPLLDPKALRDAMPVVSRNRLAELRAESTAEEKRYIAALNGFVAYQDKDAFLHALRQSGFKDSETVLQRLHDMGVIETGARTNRTPTIRIVDLYAFADELSISRRGRR